MEVITGNCQIHHDLPSNQVHQTNKHGRHKYKTVGHSVQAQTLVFVTKTKGKIVSARTVCGKDDLVDVCHPSNVMYNM